MLVPQPELPPARKPLVEAKRAQIENHRELKEREYTSVHEENRHLRDEVRDLERIVKLLKEEQRRLTNDLKEKSKDNDWSQTLLAEEKKRVERYESTQHTLRAQLDEAKANLVELQTVLRQRDETIDSMKSDVVAARSSLQQIQEELERTSAELKHAKQVRDEVLDAAAARQRSWDEERAALDDKLRRTEGTLQESDTRADEAEAQLKSVRAELVAVNAKSDQLRDEIATMKKTADEGGWSDSDDGSSKRRKAIKSISQPVEPTADHDALDAAAASMSAAVDAANAAAAERETALRAQLQQLETSKHDTVSGAKRAVDELQSRIDALIASKAALQATKDAELATLQNSNDDVTREAAANQKRFEQEKSALNTELQALTASLRSQSDARTAVEEELSAARGEIARLTALLEDAETLAIQIQQFREQRRVTDTFTSHLTSDLAAKNAELENQLLDMRAEHDDLLELLKTKVAALTGLQQEAEHFERQMRQQDIMLADKDVQLRKADEEIATLRDAVVAARLAEQDAVSARDLVRRTDASARDAMHEAQTVVSSLELEVARRDEMLMQLKAELDAEAHARSEAENRNVQLMDDLRESERRFSEMSENAVTMRDFHDSLRARNTTSSSSDAAIVAANEQLQHQLRDAVATAEEWRARSESVEAALHDVQDASRRAADSAQAKIIELQSELDRHRSEGAAATNAVYEQQLEQLKAEKEAAARAKDTAAKAAASRFDREKADLANKLKASEAMCKELENSLDAKAAQLKKQQDALNSVEKRAKQLLTEAEDRADAQRKGLLDEVNRLRQALEESQGQAGDAARAAAAARAHDEETRRAMVNLQEMQKHW
jgi:chromosome segregation ATPase